MENETVAVHIVGSHPHQPRSHQAMLHISTFRKCFRSIQADTVSLDSSCVGCFSGHCDKVSDRSNLKEEGFVSPHGFMFKKTQ